MSRVCEQIRCRNLSGCATERNFPQAVDRATACIEFRSREKQNAVPIRKEIWVSIVPRFVANETLRFGAVSRNAHIVPKRPFAIRTKRECYTIRGDHRVGGPCVNVTVYVGRFWNQPARFARGSGGIQGGIWLIISGHQIGGVDDRAIGSRDDPIHLVVVLSRQP